MPSVATAIDIARLYEELRECVRANDQGGVKRVFGELVAARRPVAEILAEVKNLTKEREEAEAEAKAAAEAKAKSSFTREWPVSTASSQFRQSPPAQAYRDFGTASEPPSPYRVAEPPRTEEALSPPAPPLWHQPAAVAAPSVAEPPSNAPEAPSLPEPPRSLELPGMASSETQTATIPTLSSPSEAVVQHTHDAPSPVAVTEPAMETKPEESARTVAFESPAPASNPVITPPLIATPSEPAHTAFEASAAVPEAPATSGPPAVETSTPEPSGVDLREILRSSSGVTAETAPETQPTQPISPAIDHAAAQSAPAALDHNEMEAASMPRRAASLGIALDAPAATVEAEPSARRIPVAAIAIAAVAIVALAGGGWFVLSPRAPEPVASTAAPAKDAAPPLIEKLRAAATPPQSAPGKAPAGGAPAAPATGGPPQPPAPPGAPTATPQNIAVPDPASTSKLEATQGLAKPDAAKEAAPAAPRAPDASAPAETSVGAKPTAPSETRLSAAETAALVSRGDAAFSVGDVASARLFYERAADAGNGDAALRLGESYDPNFLERAKLRAIKGDSKAAVFWYRRAKELGIAEADILLKGIQTK